MEPNVSFLIRGGILKLIFWKQYTSMEPKTFQSKTLYGYQSPFNIAHVLWILEGVL